MSNANRITSSINPSARPPMVTVTCESGSLSADNQQIRQINMDDDATEPQSDVALACLAIIEEWPQGHISLSHATLQLIDLLHDNDLSNEAYASYLNQLTKIDHKQALASSRGKTVIEAISSHGLMIKPLFNSSTLYHLMNMSLTQPNKLLTIQMDCLLTLHPTSQLTNLYMHGPASQLQLLPSTPASRKCFPSKKTIWSTSDKPRIIS